ncbi:hypothetical protein, partial [Actinomadura sp. GC306]|uniref:hypothetical protein n=1 Tax=Actinomadura sp. GC306 TaxID=2530367 RepID=UPI0014047223
MGWLKREPRDIEAGDTVPCVFQGSCDVCNVNLGRTADYYIRTSDVVLSEAFWRRSFAMSKRLQDDLNFGESQQLVMFDSAVSQVGAQRSPWGICQDCSELFAIADRDMARSCAVLGIEPEGSGPVEPAEFVQFAASAWEHIFGRWPATVRQPFAGDSCDLCAKKIYNGEMIGHVKKEVLEQYRTMGTMRFCQRLSADPAVLEEREDMRGADEVANSAGAQRGVLECGPA